MTEAKYQQVFFDVDSTLVTIEGIDVLARGNPEIARLTEAAMNGDVPVDQVYGKRLEIIKPSRADIDDLGQLYRRSLVDGAAEAVKSLQAAGVNVHLVTAGVAQAIAPLAAHLGVRSVHAVQLRFDDAGNYAGFDARSPLTRSHGKATVVRDIRARSKGKAAFVGDGVTDLETRSVVDLFIGFGGVQVRPRVKENADAYAMDFRTVLSHLLA